MRLDDKAAERLSCNAATLDERLSGAWYIAADMPDQALSRARLERWRARAAQGDFARFRRLPHVGPDEPALLDRLGPLGRLSPEALPRWVQTLRAVLDDLEQAAPDSAVQCSADAAAHLPFSHALAPFVGWASRQVATGAADSLEQLSPRALADLERMLLARLCGAVGPCLQTSFSLERILHHPRLVLHPDFYRAEMGDEVYATFIAGLRASGMIRFFEEYPAAARLLAVLLEQWGTAVTELLERLRRDRPELEQRLGLAAAAPVVSIEGDVSDPHNGGRSVLILTFLGGRRLVYKPRSVTPEVYFGALIDRLSELGLPRLFPRTFALERPGYGWVEYVERRDCRSREEVDAYYGRLGALLAVLYALGASDLHHENLIAHGAFPVPIDLETLLCPRQQGHAEDAVRTVLCVGMLPHSSDTAAERRADLSAIGDGRPLEQELPFGDWKHVNRDNMNLAAPQAVPVERRSLPRLNGVARHAHDHAQPFIAGFRRAYRALLGAAPLLLADGARSLPEECAIRVVFRDTQEYASLLTSAQEPAVMTAGVDRSIELEALFQPLAERPELHPLIRAEQQSLEDLDIPYLWVTAGGRDLRAGDKVIAPGFFAASGIEVARGRLARLSEQDLERQIAILKDALCAPRIREPQEAAAPRGHESPAAAQAIDAARKIAARIRALALPGDAPGWRWVAPEVDGDGQSTLKLLGPGLYDGTAGIGLFFAALSRLTGDEADRRMAFEVLAPARALLRSSRLARWIEARGVGVTTGIGSILYALLASGRLLEDRRLTADAAASAAFAVSVEGEGRLDLSSGDAGAVLALVALYRETRDEHLLRLAIAHGDALLEAWREQAREAPIHRRGLLLGVDGVWLALRRLSLTSGAPRFREAADAAERAARPLSASGDRRGAVRMSWCNGLAGVTLGQVASMTEPAGEQASAGAARAVDAIAAVGGGFVDPPCCGTLGRVELLLYAGQRLSRPELLTVARGLSTSIAERARRGVVTTRFPMHHPGFFRGLSGVGYELLRAAFPEQLPSVLAFE